MALISHWLLSQAYLSLCSGNDASCLMPNYSPVSWWSCLGHCILYRVLYYYYCIIIRTASGHLENYTFYTYQTNFKSHLLPMDIIVGCWCEVTQTHTRSLPSTYESSSKIFSTRTQCFPNRLTSRCHLQAFNLVFFPKVCKSKMPCEEATSLTLMFCLLLYSWQPLSHIIFRSS